MLLLCCRSLDDCLPRTKPVLQRLDQSPLAAQDNVLRDHADIAVASKVSLADRLEKFVHVCVTLLVGINLSFPVMWSQCDARPMITFLAGEHYCRWVVWTTCLQSFCGSRMSGINALHSCTFVIVGCTVNTASMLTHFILLLYSLIMPPCVADADVIFCSCGYFILSFSFFSSPILSGRRLDVYHTSTHDVALVWI